jgi:hypothetical protein
MQINPRPWSLSSTIISIGVVACLCFSIGEGLRLTPFPVSNITETETSKDDDNSIRKYGPLDVPTRTKNRKRQLVDYVCSTPARSLSQHRSIASEDELIAGPSLPLSSHPSGRAPPTC